MNRAGSEMRARGPKPRLPAPFPAPYSHPMSHDLFDAANPATESSNASQIEVLEGLEPVRRHPGLYIGGTDERPLHHPAAEVTDNRLEPPRAGHAPRTQDYSEPPKPRLPAPFPAP